MKFEHDILKWSHVLVIHSLLYNLHIYGPGFIHLMAGAMFA